MRHHLTIASSTTLVLISMLWGAPVFAQQGSLVKWNKDASNQRAQMRDDQSQLKQALQIVRDLKYSQRSQQCTQIKKAAQRVLTTPHTTDTDQHEATQALLQCERRELPSAQQTKRLSIMRSTLANFRKLTAIKQKSQATPNSTHVIGWSVAGHGAALASSAMIYIHVDVSPDAQTNQQGATVQEKRRFLEARNRLRQLHWLIPTIYSISGSITREGITVVDEDPNGREARLIPTWRGGGVGARLRIRF